MAKDDDNKNSYGSFNFRLPDNFGKQISDAIKSIAETYEPLVKASSQWVESVRQSQIELAKVIGNIDFSGISKVAETISKSLEGHFPDNWSEHKMGECAELCVKGVPIIFVPRSSIVEEMLRAKDMAGIKRVAVRNDRTIIEDCEKVIHDSEWLTRDMREQIIQSIECYKDKKYRAAQGTAMIAFDSLLNEIIDMRKLRKVSNDPRKLSHSTVRKLTDVEIFKNDLMQLPLQGVPFYTLLMFPVIGQMLTLFEIGDRTTYMNGPNRHMTTHTVDSKQYKPSNALLTIMAVAAICKITQLRGKNWMQDSADAYGVAFN